MEAFELSPTVIKAVGIGRIGGIGARILSELGSNGQDCTWFDAGGGDFNHSEFDVRSSLSGGALAPGRGLVLRWGPIPVIRCRRCNGLR